MQSDNTLNHRQQGKRIIIDTKFTNVLTGGRLDVPSLKSGHVYQIYAYLRSQERGTDPPSLTASGMLLHPSIDQAMDESVTIQGHRIRFVTVDMRAEAAEIRRELIASTNP